MTSFIFYLGGIFMLLHYMYISGGMEWLIGIMFLIIGYIIDDRHRDDV